MGFITSLIISIMLLLSNTATASTKYVRWTGFEDSQSDFKYILNQLNLKLTSKFSASDFRLMESKTLSTSEFEMYAQVVQGLPVFAKSIRIWKSRENANLVQMEAYVDPTLNSSISNSKLFLQVSDIANFSNSETLRLVKSIVAKSSDTAIFDFSYQDYWETTLLVRKVRVKARLGIHEIDLAVSTKIVLSHRYNTFPQSEMIKVAAKVFPLFEESFGGAKAGRVDAELKYIYTTVKRFEADPLTPLQTRKYPENMQDELKAKTESGWNEGFWSFEVLSQKATELYASVPSNENGFSGSGLALTGKYVSVTVHPESHEALKTVGLPIQYSDFMYSTWKPLFSDGQQSWEIIPQSALYPRAFFSQKDVLDAPARRLPDHNPIEYIRDGFDSIQVYFATTELMDRLQNYGFVDPELSTRPFRAYLYDPEISMKNNAYYTGDTINFTTYSGNEPNLARDNTTVWHELGHGLMDRLMGNYLSLSDVGGLSEGMADFISYVVTEDVSNGQPYDGEEKNRILNKIGFHFTNEVHDDGEAYGGSMKDLYDLAIQKYGKIGGIRATDLIFEGMRLCRNHPSLTVNEWFEHLQFADRLGSPLRVPGAMAGLVEEAYFSRNFSDNPLNAAKFSLMHAGSEIHHEAQGARENPIPVRIEKDGNKTFKLEVAIDDGANYQFKYPVELRVFTRTGPLQGAVKWKDESDQPTVKTLTSTHKSDTVEFTALGECDEYNRTSRSCVDYLYLQLWDQSSQTHPVAKKRFYIHVKNK